MALLKEEEKLCKKGKECFASFSLFEFLLGFAVIFFILFSVECVFRTAQVELFRLGQEIQNEDPAKALFVIEDSYIPDIENIQFNLFDCSSYDFLISKSFEFNKEDSKNDVQKTSEKPLSHTGFLREFKGKVVKDKLRPGESIYLCLKRHNIPPRLRYQIISKLRKVINVRKLKPGEEFELFFNKKGNLVALRWSRNSFETYEISIKKIKGKKSQLCLIKLPITFEKKIIKVTGKITGGLIDSFENYGLTPGLARKFAEVFSSKIDFNTDIKDGDTFKVIYQEFWKDGKKIGQGRILAATYCFGDRPCLDAFYFKGKDMKYGGYFTHDGRIIGNSFMRSPLKVYRITSRFTPRRFHPVLKVFRPHYGVDLAAPIGTPVMAVADGVVTFTGWQRGYGRIVIIKHQGNYTTYYGHLSRFGKGIKKGVKVRQKQIIGYVGRSGYATGPHLDYRVKKNGRFINPFKVKFSRIKEIPKMEKADFLAEVKKFQDILLDKTIKGIVYVKKETHKGLPEDLIG